MSVRSKTLKVNLPASIPYVIIDGIPDEYRILEFSPGAESLLGYKKNNLIGKSFSKISRVNSTFNFSEVLKTVRHTSKNICMDIIYILEAGNEYSAVTSVFTLDNTQFKNPVICFLIHDRNLLQDKEQTIFIKEKAIEVSLNAIAMSDMQAKITFVNKSFLDFWEIDSRKDVIGRSFLDFWENKADASAVIAIIMETGSWEGKLRAKCFNGKSKIFRLQANMINDHAGSPIHMVASFIDVTKCEDFTRVLKESEEKFRNMYENTSIGIARVGLGFEIIEANRAYCDMLGYTETELAGKTLADITHPEIVEENLRKQRLLGLGKISSFQMEKAFIHKDGHTVYGILNATLIHDAKGDPSYFLGNVLDITDLKRIERELKQSLDEKNVLLKELHHRTKNNMQIICALLSLQELNTEDENLKNIFRETSNRIKSMALVHQKFYMSEKLSKINMREYIMELISLLSKNYHFEGNNIQVKHDLQDIELPITYAIPCGLIMNELISNSFKHAFPEKKTGIITVALKKQDSDIVMIQVSDNGRGVANTDELYKSASLGIKNAEIITKQQLNGTIEFVSDNGLIVTVRFKKN